MGQLFNAALAEKLTNQGKEIAELKTRLEALEALVKKIDRSYVPANGNNH